MMEMQINLEERCLNFGVSVVRLLQSLPEEYRHVARTRQLEKCATSIGANVAEGKSAQSRADFISKFEIALKEARETDYWLRLFKETGLGPKAGLCLLIGECWQITAILVTSVKTAKKNGGIVENRLQKAIAESRDQN